MIYLSWSTAQLAAHIIVLVAAYSVFIVKYKDFRSGISKIFAALLILTLLLAFDVGTKQENLHRSSFNNESHDVLIKKTERSTMSRTDAVNNLNKTIEESK